MHSDFTYSCFMSSPSQFLDLIIIILLGDECYLWSSSFWRSSKIPDTSSVFILNTILSNLFSKSVSQCSLYSSNIRLIWIIRTNVCLCPVECILKTIRMLLCLNRFWNIQKMTVIPRLSLFSSRPTVSGKLKFQVKYGFLTRLSGPCDLWCGCE
jgi:hypothetical protein